MITDRCIGPTRVSDPSVSYFRGAMNVHVTQGSAQTSSSVGSMLSTLSTYVQELFSGTFNPGLYFS